MPQARRPCRRPPRSTVPTWTTWRPAGQATSFDSGAPFFLARYPDPQAWAGLPLEQRLAGWPAPARACGQVLNFLGVLHRPSAAGL